MSEKKISEDNSAGITGIFGTVRRTLDSDGTLTLKGSKFANTIGQDP